MTANNVSRANDSDTLDSVSGDPVIRSDIETEDRFLRFTTEEEDQAAATNESTATPQTRTGSMEPNRELLNSPEAKQAKKQFRRATDSKVLSTASVGTDRILILESQCTGEWMTRVPAERRAVLKGQRLWRIPDNWERRARITNEHGPDEILFRIPDTRIDVVVEDLACGGGARAGYRIDTIGRTVVKLTEMPDKSSLQDLLMRIQEDGNAEVSSDVEGTLQLLLDRWSRFESSYISYYHKWASKHVHGAFQAEDTVTFDGWSIELWDERQTVEQFIYDVCGVGSDISDPMNKLLLEAGVVSSSPTVTIMIKDKEFRIGYGVQAAVEAGCSPSEAVDYLMDRFQSESDGSWESARPVDDATVRDNVREARNAF